MAVLTSPTIKYDSGAGGGTPRCMVVSFQNVTTADTWDAASAMPSGVAPFTTVTAALAVATSNRTATTTLCTIATNTNISLLGTGIARDSVFLFLVGE